MKNTLLALALCLFAAAPAFSQETEPEIKQMTGDVGSTWKSVFKALQDVDTRLYRIQVVKKRGTETFGNAELGRLQMVSLFGERETTFSTGNLIEVKAARGTSTTNVEFIKLIWTAAALEEIKDKVEEVNNLLKKASTPPSN